MDNTLFVNLAYAITGFLLGMLCLITWLRARTVSRETDPRREP